MLQENKIRLENNWYVIQIRTRNEEEICNYFNEILNEYEMIAFYPQTQKIVRPKGKIVYLKKPMFPGYIIISSDSESGDFIKTIYKSNYRQIMFKILGKRSLDNMCITKKEKNRILKLCDDDYIVKKTFGYVVGDRVKITDGLLKGMESQIKRINKSKMYAEVELEFMGSLRRVALPLEIITKQT